MKVEAWKHSSAIDLKNGNGDCYEGEPKSGAANTTLTIEDDDYVKLAEGKLNPQQVQKKPFELQLFTLSRRSCRAN